MIVLLSRVEKATKCGCLKNHVKTRQFNARRGFVDFSERNVKYDSRKKINSVGVQRTFWN
jgi:hypothetical protein